MPCSGVDTPFLSQDDELKTAVAKLVKTGYGPGVKLRTIPTYRRAVGVCRWSVLTRAFWAVDITGCG